MKYCKKYFFNHYCCYVYFLLLLVIFSSGLRTAGTDCVWYLGPYLRWPMGRLYHPWSSSLVTWLICLWIQGYTQPFLIASVLFWHQSTRQNLLCWQMLHFCSEFNGRRGVSGCCVWNRWMEMRQWVDVVSETGKWKQGSEWMWHLKQVNGYRGVSGCCV